MFYSQTKTYSNLKCYEFKKNENNSYNRQVRYITSKALSQNFASYEMF